MVKFKIIAFAAGLFLVCQILDINATGPVTKLSQTHMSQTHMSQTHMSQTRVSQACLPAQDVFGSWICSQKCYSDCSLADMSDRLNEFFLQKFNKRYLKHKDKLSLFVPFLNDCTDGYVSKNGDIASLQINDEFRRNFSTVYRLIETSMPKFILYLNDHGFAESENAKQFRVGDNCEDAAAVKSVIDSYNTLVRLFFSNPDKCFEKEHLFAFANRCFEYCFNPESWPDFNGYLNRPVTDSQFVKFLYSIIWRNLVGQGWKDWNSQTLAKIAKKSRHGTRVVYVAGGMDIYQLLKNGIYNIDIIDPFLESQDKYYASAYWKWFIKGDGKNNGVKDKIVFDFDGRKVNLIRKTYSKDKMFDVLLSTGKNQKIEKSVTDWIVSDQDNKYLGKITLHRRFCEQGDFPDCDNKFNKKKGKTKGVDRLVLMSFNELYYAFLPKKLGGWGINIDSLPKDFKIYAKQLRAPVTVDVLRNIRKAEDANFKFIRLGSDPA